MSLHQASRAASSFFRPRGQRRSTRMRAPAPGEMNRRLHGERLVPGTHRRRFHPRPWADLPDGTFVIVDDTPAVVVRDHLAEWTTEGYRHRRPRPRHGNATVVTPPSTVAAFRAGYA